MERVTHLHPKELTDAPTLSTMRCFFFGVGGGVPQEIPINSSTATSGHEEEQPAWWEMCSDLALPLSQEVLPHGRLRQPLCSHGEELLAARLLRIIAMCTFTQVTLTSDGPRKCCLLVGSFGKLRKMSQE